jgi:hypothetical protein
MKVKNWFQAFAFSNAACVLRHYVLERTSPAIAPYWEMAEWYQSVLGFSTVGLCTLNQVDP